MQISTHETQKVLRHAPRVAKRKEPPVRNLADLARKYGVDLAEAKAATRRAMSMDEDVARERRVRDLAARVAEGSYSLSGDQVVDMAERRAIVDRIR
jgi:anti-sigma28 factor (negative regulator of flagellin synthesis)